MRNFTSTVFIGSILAVTTNFSIIQPSQAAYPPACGVKPTTTEEGTARTNLRKNLGSNNYPVETQAQAHHIVPLALFTTADGIKLCKYGINLLEGAENGVWLPSYYCTNKAPKASPPYLHRGSHKDYTDYVGLKIATATSKASAQKIIDEIRNTLLTGKKTDLTFPDTLNNADPARSVICS